VGPWSEQRTPVKVGETPVAGTSEECGQLLEDDRR